MASEVIFALCSSFLVESTALTLRTLVVSGADCGSFTPPSQNETRLFSLLPRAFPTISAWQYLGWTHHKGILEKPFPNYKFNKNTSMY